MSADPNLYIDPSDGVWFSDIEHEWYEKDPGSQILDINEYNLGGFG